MKQQKQRRSHVEPRDLHLIVSLRFDTGKATPTNLEVRRLDLARRLGDCGARPVLEALHAVQRGESKDSVLDAFAAIPRGCDRARLPGEIASIAVSAREAAE
ncbi:hypothetical protein GOC05_13485 [Sinorhizobium meliloti]|nr:hypothetical protein [Sinorhizobium meliloti]